MSKETWVFISAARSTFIQLQEENVPVVTGHQVEINAFLWTGSQPTNWLVQ